MLPPWNGMHWLKLEFRGVVEFWQMPLRRRARRRSFRLRRNSPQYLRQTSHRVKTGVVGYIGRLTGEFLLWTSFCFGWERAA